MANCGRRGVGYVKTRPAALDVARSRPVKGSASGKIVDARRTQSVASPFVHPKTRMQA